MNDAIDATYIPEDRSENSLDFFISALEEDNGKELFVLLRDCELFDIRPDVSKDYEE